MSRPLPARGEVQLFAWGLDGAASDAVLSPDEKERAARFKFERDRSRYIKGRVTLRELAGSYLGVDARDVRFAYGPNGKPELAGSTLRFNLSHSEDRALCAFGSEAALGVDLEKIRPIPDGPGIIERYFGPREREWFAAAQNQQQAFYTLWTLKEAVLKAGGMGLTRPLDEFDVIPNGDEAIDVVGVHVKPLALSGFAAAVAAECVIGDLSVLTV